MSNIEIIEGRSSRPVVLLCDHAGHRIPPEIGSLGISDEQLARHIGWDIGAAAVTRILAARWDVTAVLDHVSRLVIDPNRRPYGYGSVPAVSDGCVVPGNHALGRDEIRRRIGAYFVPYHRKVARVIGSFRRRGAVPVVIAVHSFTPRMHGEDRPWHVGLLWRGDQRLSRPVIDRLHDEPGLVVGDNQPYSGFRDLGFTMAFHCLRTGLPHLMLEIRQDEISTDEGVARYADLVARVIEPSLADPGLFALHDGDDVDAAGGKMSWRPASLVSPLA